MHENGTYAALYLSEASAQQLVQWCQQQEIDHQSADEMHCTLIYSRTPVPALQQFDCLPVQARAKILGWRQLGDALVLELDFPEAERLNQLMTAAGATSDHPSYIAHTTVNPSMGNIELPDELPAFDLLFDRVHVSELDPTRSTKKIDELAPFKGTEIYRQAQALGSLSPHRKGSSRLDNLLPELYRMGWRKLGTGYYAHVLEHPRYPYVLKLFTDDPNYFRYFEWVRRNQSNPHVPRVRGKYIKINDDTYAVRMEKLEPIGEYFSWRLFYPQNREQLRAQEPALADLLDRLEQWKPRLDLHDQNVMQRADGTVVITDPVTSIGGELPALESRVNEAFDTTVRWVEESTPNQLNAAAIVADSYVEIVYYSDTNWKQVDIAFSRNGRDNITGEGSAMQIFGAVINHIARFVARHQPERVTFNAQKPQYGWAQERDTRRSDLYRHMVRRYADRLGYTVRILSGLSLDEFVLDRKDSKSPVQETAQQLDEINMSPGALQSFAASADAVGIRIGFEAEMSVPGLGFESEDEDPEPDWEYDRRIRADTIPELVDELVDFFSDTQSRRDVERTVDEINEDILEYMEEEFNNYWRNDDAYLREIISDALGEDPDSDAVDEEIANQGQDFMDAVQTLRDEYYESWDNLSGALRRLNLHEFSGWTNRFDWIWPYYTQGGTEGSEDIEEFGGDLADALDITVRTGGGYKSVARGDYWVVETDPSISGDGAPIEIISPPMELGTGLQKLQQLLDWASDQGAKTNSSTGLHVGVSLPAELHQNIDYVKLILLLGDNYVLNRFGRSSNSYTSSALGKISQALRSAVSSTSEQMPNFLNRMQQDLSAHARTYFRQKLISSDKYVSVNIKNNYIEFRSMGGDYLQQKDAVINTVMRYVRVIAAAANDADARDEYAKKFYKLIRSSIPENIEDRLIEIFTQYSSGKLPAAALKSYIRQAQQQRKQKISQPEGGVAYELYDPGRGALHRLLARNDQDARARFEQWAAEEMDSNLNAILARGAVINRVAESIQEQLASVPTPSIQQLAAKWGTSVRAILDQVRLGVRVEAEHTTDFNAAMEIALDHINEIPDYYDRLQKMERGAGLKETIRHQGSKWVIYSQDGKKKLGTYDTKKAAQKRLRQIEYFKHRNESVEGQTEPPLDSKMLDQVERYADQLFADVGIDVEFTRHFVDRLHDERNRKPITAGELAQLFKRERERWGRPIANLGPDAQAVMQDMRTDINIPFVLRWDAKNQELDLIAKTVMRKKNFQTSNRRFVVNSKQ